MIDDRHEAYRSMLTTSLMRRELDTIPDQYIPNILYECIVLALNSEAKSPQLIFNEVIKRYDNVRK